MSNFLTDSKSIIAMIHVDPLPGTPRNKDPLTAIIARAKQEALIYKNAGIDVLAIENMHDIPYLNRKVGPEITAAMAIIAYEVKNVSGLPCGMQILAGANQAALGAALAGGLDFIRAEGFVFAHVADEGIIESDAGSLLRYRRQIGAEHVSIFTDIKKKHSAHTLTGDVDIAESAHAAEFFMSDGVIVTGASTGVEASLKELQQVKSAVNIPVLIGSGITLDNVEAYLNIADALIVGSYFKTGGHWTQGVDFARVKAFMDKVNRFKRFGDSNDSD